MERLLDKVVIVTGGARGLGFGIGEACAREGAQVILADLHLEAAQRAAEQLSQQGWNAIGLLCDVTRWNSVEQLVHTVGDRYGKVDVYVNNAGWDKVKPFLEMGIDEWDPVIRINLYGTLHGAKAVLPLMVSQKSGTIINIASDAGRVGSSGEAVYSATKGGVIAFTKTLARETARYGIRVNCVSPGPADTPLLEEIGKDHPKLVESLTRAIPLRRLAEPRDIAGAVVYLASDEASYVTGQTLSVSGGLTMA
jgi:2-hydroxycyclohexanecarboxyl-CoA dehydrogenase